MALALALESGSGEDLSTALGAAALPLMIDNVSSSSSASGNSMRNMASEPASVQSDGSRCPYEGSRRVFEGANPIFSQGLGLAHRICICTSTPGSLFGGKGILGPR
jgi:hypothetical protein